MKGKTVGETEINSKNEKVDQTAQNVKNVTELKADTVVTETVKLPKKADKQEDHKTKAQT